MHNTHQNILKTNKVIAILWPSFITAGIATILFFTAFDPQLLMIISNYGEISRLGGYSVGFFLFWLLTSSTSALTRYFQQPPQHTEQQSSDNANS